MQKNKDSADPDHTVPDLSDSELQIRWGFEANSESEITFSCPKVPKYGDT